MALVDTGNGMTYSAEKTLSDGTTLVATVNRPSFQSNTLNLRASIVTAAGAYTPIPASFQELYCRFIPRLSMPAGARNRVLSNRFRSISILLAATLCNDRKV